MPYVSGDFTSYSSIAHNHLRKMRIALLIHIIGGGLGLVSGAVALYAAKGATLHRKSGMWFVYTMLTMSLSGALIAALTAVHISVIMGLLTAYLVFTSLTTVRRRVTTSRWLDIGPMMLALALGIVCIGLGVDVLAAGESQRGGVPMPMFFVFGTIALSAGAADIRMLRGNELKGVRRLARHLWRMCFALFIASASFFLGQSDKFPESLRIYPVLIAISLAPLVFLFYWLWRVRFKKSTRGIITVSSPETAG